MSSETIVLSPRSDGARYRRVTIAVGRDGVITLKAHEMAAGGLDPWGLDEDEMTLVVPRRQVGRLALALAAEVLKDSDDGVARLARICEAHAVPFRIARWS